MKKRILSSLLLTVLAALLLLSGCQKKTAAGSARPREAQVSPAIDALKDTWRQCYDRQTGSGSDRYLEIKNTRLIQLKQSAGEMSEIFQDVDYVVEFALYSNYFSSAPYYMNAGTYDCVLFYRDGSSKVSGNVFQRYAGQHYSYDFSHIIDSVEDLGDAYNQVLKV